MGLHFNCTDCRVARTITPGRENHHHIVGGGLSNHRLEKYCDTQIRCSADFSVAFRGFAPDWTAWMEVRVDRTSEWTNDCQNPVQSWRENVWSSGL